MDDSCPDGGAARKAADEKKVAELLATRNMTILDLARLCAFVKKRRDKGKRITSGAVELAFEELDFAAQLKPTETESRLKSLDPQRFRLQLPDARLGRRFAQW